MKKYSIVILFLWGLAYLSPTTANAQQNFYGYRLGVSGGTMLYYGDLVDKYPRPAKYLDIAYGVQFEKSFSKGFGLRLSGTRGKIAYNDRTRTLNDELLTDNPNFYRNLNFQTKIWDAAAAFVWYADNDRLFSDRAFLSPYISLGIGATWFDVFGDRLDANGNLYDYSNPNLEQDGDYETNLTNLKTEDVAYKTRAWHIPLGLGLKFRLGDRWNFNLEANVKYTNTDYLDDVRKRGNDGKWDKDLYAYTSASLNYNFGLKKKAFNAPIIIADRFAKINHNDSLMLKLATPATTTATEAKPISEKEKRRTEKAEAKQAKKDAKAAEKAAKEAQKRAKKQCLAGCKALPKEERKGCEAACKAADFSKIDTKKEEAKSEEAVSVNNNDSQKIDSLRQVIQQETETRRQQQDAAPTMPAMPIPPYGTQQPIIVMPPSPAVAPANPESEARAMLLQTQVQDLKMQVELLKMQLQQQGGFAAPSQINNNTALMETYRLEIDRLRQESSDAKVLGKLDELQKSLLQMQQAKPAVTQPAPPPMPPAVSNQVDIATKVQMEQMNRQIEELQKQIIELKRLQQQKPKEEGDAGGKK